MVKKSTSDNGVNGPPSNKRILEIDDQLISCQICMHKYDRQKRVPLVLKCGHTVCEQCARALIKYGRVKCPFDNQQFDNVNVELLGRNFTLLDLIDAERQEISLEADERLCQ